MDINLPSRKYLRELPLSERRDLAAKIKIRHETLYQIGIGYRTPSRKLAYILQVATAGKVAEIDFDNEAKENSSAKYPEIFGQVQAKKGKKRSAA